MNELDIRDVDHFGMYEGDTLRVYKQKDIIFSLTNIGGWPSWCGDFEFINKKDCICFGNLRFKNIVTIDFTGLNESKRYSVLVNPVNGLGFLHINGANKGVGSSRKYLINRPPYWMENSNLGK